MDNLLGRGDIQVDKDGSEWYIIGASFKEGKPEYHRVKVGSLAHQIHSKGEEGKNEGMVG